MVNDQLKSSVEGPKASELRALVDRWSLSDEEVADGPDGWQKKYEEITVFVTLLACATGRKGKEIRVDFFLVSHSCPLLYHPILLPYGSSGTVTNSTTLLSFSFSERRIRLF